MNMKRVISSVLLLFVAVSVIFITVGELRGVSHSPESSGEDEKTPESAVLSPDADVDIVYYFMTSARCVSCMKIEEYTRETVQRDFARELEEGSLIWRMIEVDVPANSHFIKQYQLFTKSVVLSKIRGGRETEWKNLDKVWPLLNDKETFTAYVSDEVRTFLETD